MLHNNGIVHQHPTGKTWYSAIFIETFFYCAVPLFFMITGTTLIDYKKRYNTQEFLSKRIKKTLIPFLFWSFFGICYLCVKNKSFDIFENDIFSVISDIFNTSYIDIYWFFPTLFGVYFCIPILSEINNKTKVFKYMIIIELINMSILPFICNLISIQYNYELVPKFVYGYIIYIVLGYYIDNKEISKKERKLIYSLGLLGFLSNFIGTAVLTGEGGYKYFI